jgi:tripartite ATP-independent transporter DctM subunit
MLGIIMFFSSLGLLMLGVPVAFAFAFASMMFAFFVPDVGLEIFELFPYRIYGIMQNYTLISVPLFIFMGLILEKSKIAQNLLVNLSSLFGSIRGGLAISIVFVGAILGAMTGIVGASVVMMALISLPIMINYGYSKSLSSGVIAASGTLGQIIPPSIVLIILGDVMSISVGDLFLSSLVPSFILIGLYIAYIYCYALIKPEVAPVVVKKIDKKSLIKDTLKSVIAPLILIWAVLGSIFTGVASPTESAAIGVLGAVILAIFNKTLTFEIFIEATKKTVSLTSMIFIILIGATAFSLVFNELEGIDFILEFFEDGGYSKWTFIFLSMALIFVLGFFIDFIEISFIIVPILAPIASILGIDPIWFAILIALNLQTSFLTPPFGFALFYLKGASKDLVSTVDIYRGVVPFIILQFIALAIVMIFPKIIYIFD